MATDKEGTPPPGSKEAFEKGCICPILDNSHGKGYMGVSGIFVYVEGCPVHPTPGVRTPENAEVSRGDSRCDH